MTNNFYQTNGASLEDCHTNFFALTDLCGIKWRKLLYHDPPTPPTPLDDPVLRSYAHCLANDILCVWRRVASIRSESLYDLAMPPPLHPPMSLSAAKELWIFWYGEEPDLSGMVAPELIAPDGEQGSWESGLSYECRSLLFKALHNLIERCLLSRDFVRLGKWFVQPYEGSKKNIGPSTTHLSFSFAYFLHGESTVCASIDVRIHPPLYPLSPHHLTASLTGAMPVILAPFGLAGTLTAAPAQPAERVLEDWGRFYPVKGGRGVPDTVEVVVGGVRMRYPSWFVLVTDMDEKEESSPSSPPPTPPPPPFSKLPQPGQFISVEHPQSMQRPKTAAQVLPERVWQECMLGGPPGAQGQEWGFVEPTRRAQCTCNKCRRYVGPSKSASKGTKGPRRVPFHRRSLQTIAIDADRCQQGSSTPQGGPPSYPRTQESLAVPSVGSPPSAAPSPLQNSSQPASVPTAEQPMPTLSPHATAPISSPTDKTPQPNDPPKSVGSPTSPNASQNAGPGQEKTEIEGKSHISIVTLKRPVLTSKEYENAVLEEEQTLDLLYDYSTLDAWLNHPVKRFKPDSKENKQLKIGKGGDIYSLYGTPNGVQTQDYENSAGTQCFIKQEIKEEPAANFSLDAPPKRPGDPYEFDEEGTNVTMDGFKRGQQEKKCPAGNLFTNEGLQPSYKDLDQIFDNSDDTSSDEALQVQTPPGSTTSLDLKRAQTCSVLRPEELSKMFPTPPSLEHNPIASPCGPLDDPIKHEPYPSAGSPPNETIDDWGYVFKPAIVSRIIGSSKYAPLNNLPSAVLPQMVLSENCVYKPSWLDKTLCEKIFIQTPGFRTPLPYEQASPASTSSSYLNKNLNSVEETLPALRAPEINSLLLNILLSDSFLNIFRDHNFDSCTLCVCNATLRCIGNLKGADSIYRTVIESETDEDDSIKCTCGFSSVINRKLSHKSGLFFEDEFEITNLNHEENSEEQKSLEIPPEILELIRESCTFLQNDSNALYRSANNYRHHINAKNSLFSGKSVANRLETNRFDSNRDTSNRFDSNRGQIDSNRGQIDRFDTDRHHIKDENTLFTGKNTTNRLQVDRFDSNRAQLDRFDSSRAQIDRFDSVDRHHIKDENAHFSGKSVANRTETNRFDSNRDITSKFDSNRAQIDRFDTSDRHHIKDENAHFSGKSVANRLETNRFDSNRDTTNRFDSNRPQIDSNRALDSNKPQFDTLDRHHIKDENTLFSGKNTTNRLQTDRFDSNRDTTNRFDSNRAQFDSNRAQFDRFDSNDRHHIKTENLLFSDKNDSNRFEINKFDSNRCQIDRFDSNRPQFDRFSSNRHHIEDINLLEFSDTNNLINSVLEELKVVSSYESSRQISVHKWCYLNALGPKNNQDILRIMINLQPFLQEAVQKKCTTRLWEAPYIVKGPLTWRQFHRLAGRGADDRCEPQPIPSLLVGYEKNWLSVSPYSIFHWENLSLSPYSYLKDIAYIVVAPDNEAILPRVRMFFRELSTVYEMCKLGKHRAITKILRDGILRVGKGRLVHEPVEEWVEGCGGEVGDMIKMYAQACKHHLAPHLLQVPMDKTLLDPPETVDKSSMDRPASSPMPPPNTPDNTAEKAPSTPKNEQETSEPPRDSTPTVSSLPDSSHDDEDTQAPNIVVYLVEPFTFGSDQPELHRLACVALLRCFQSVLTAIPENIRSNISVQIISQESIVELGKSRERNRQSDHMRSLALSIFSQCKRYLVHSSNVKSLTGFGTAAMADLFLKSKDEKNRAPFKLPSPPYILSSPFPSEPCSILYLSYCLSHSQNLILAVCTDDRGAICESVTINIADRKRRNVRRIGLDKLFEFVLGVMSRNVIPWRLIIGKLGRIGHGELKSWSYLLSRKNLLCASKQLRELCQQCSVLSNNQVPCVLSACLVSLEPSNLRLFCDKFTPDQRFSTVSINSSLSTPADVSCTHILVFPTSAVTQSSQTAFQETHINCPDLGDEELFNALHDDDIEGLNDGLNDFNDIFSVWPERSPERRERRESPVGGGREGAEEVGTLLQQPLALGYLVSTAPTGHLPRWFWSSCPHLEGVCPAFLKNALHLHSPAIQQSSDDLLQQAQVTSHPLDSQYTTDVLRFVLEGYNALSWLALDTNTQDRLSCLPVHIQVLIQLYHLTASLL